MRYSILLLLLGFLSFSFIASAQSGIGIGSKGINFKTNPEKKVRMIARLRPGATIGSGNLDLYIQPGVNVVKHFLTNDQIKPYIGIGVAAYIRVESSNNTTIISPSYNAFLPVLGVEWFPGKDNQFVSVASEFALDLRTNEKFNSLSISTNGNLLLEITFYLRKKASKEG